MMIDIWEYIGNPYWKLEVLMGKSWENHDIMIDIWE